MSISRTETVAPRPSISGRETSLQPTVEDQIRGYILRSRLRHEAQRLSRGGQIFRRSLESQLNPEAELSISQQRRAQQVPAETLYQAGWAERNHRVYQHYSDERVLVTEGSQIELPFITNQSFNHLDQAGLQHLHIGMIMIRLHTLHRRSAGVNTLVLLRDTRWTDDRAIISSMEMDLTNDHLASRGVRAIPGQLHTTASLQGRQWIIRLAATTAVQNPQVARFRSRSDRSVSIRFTNYMQPRPATEITVGDLDEELIEGEVALMMTCDWDESEDEFDDEMATIQQLLEAQTNSENESSLPIWDNSDEDDEEWSNPIAKALLASLPTVGRVIAGSTLAWTWSPLKLLLDYSRLDDDEKSVSGIYPSVLLDGDDDERFPGDNDELRPDGDNELLPSGDDKLFPVNNDQLLPNKQDLHQSSLADSIAFIDISISSSERPFVSTMKYAANAAAIKETPPKVP
ncbi:polyprotein [Canna indica]|uniref:Polyprotein n=1 Tax=Canna indica TaxID=4628 RepID=A0AAQ3JNT8_9LILI|nr:polyprotein [Canna indica]